DRPAAVSRRRTHFRRPAPSRGALGCEEIPRTAETCARARAVAKGPSVPGGVRPMSITSRRSPAYILMALLAAASLLVAFAREAGAQPAGAEPAPVPAAVAIPRPTPDEVEIARRALERFISGADAETRAIVEKYPGLLEVRTPPPNTAVIPNLAPFFQAKHQANLEVARRGDAEVLFIGDSITDFWRNEEGEFAGKPVFDEYFGHWKVANFGIAGDTTQGVLYRLRNGEGEGFSPRAVMLMIGTNNTGRNTAAEIAEGIGAVVLELQQRFSEARILLLG